MRLTEDKVSLIRASQGVYRATDVAREYDVHRSTVTRIWAGDIHTEVEAAPEPPNIITKPRPRDLAEDINILLARGEKMKDVAVTLGISIGAVAMYRGVWV